MLTAVTQTLFTRWTMLHAPYGSDTTCAHALDTENTKMWAAALYPARRFIDIVVTHNQCP